MSHSFVESNLKWNFCAKIHEKEVMSFSGAIASSVVLTLLGILGTIGNSLVIIVYCWRPKPRFPKPFMILAATNVQTVCSDLASRMPKGHSKRSWLNPLKNTRFESTKSIKVIQQHLILILAFVDLLTCIIVLPMDVFRVVHQSIFDNSTRETEPRLEYMISDDGHYFPSQYALDDIVTLLRNVMFACEGSILAAIAFDRYLTVVGTTHRCCMHKVQKPINKLDPDFQSYDDKLNSQNFSNKYNDSETQSDPIACCQCRLELCCPPGYTCCPMPSRCLPHSGNPKHSCCIWGIILIVTLSVTCLEICTSFTHFSQARCPFPGDFREYVNQIYIFCTLISFVVVSFLYIRIFLIVRSSDLKRKSWNHRAPSSGKQQNNSVFSKSEYPSMVSLKTLNYCELMDSQNDGAEFDVPVLPSNSGNSSLIIRNSKDLSKSRSSKTKSIIPVNFSENPNANRTSKCVVEPEFDKGRTGINSASVTDQPTITESSSPTITHPNSNITYSEQDNRKLRSGIRTETNSSVKPTKPKNVLRSRRTALMLFISTLVFYATLLPNLWFHLKWWSNSGILHSLGKEKSHISVLNVHHEFYYVNNAINFFVYSLLNKSFRDRLRLLLSRI